MKHRKLRIAWSVGWGVVAVLVLMLWVRSYWRWDSLVWGVTTKQGVLACSQSGRTMFEYLDVRATPANLNARLFKWKLQTYPPGGTTPLPPSVAGFLVDLSEAQLGAPFWFLILIMAAVASLSWLPWSNRFGLRTLLIATTLVAVALGLIVWASR